MSVLVAGYFFFCSVLNYRCWRLFILIRVQAINWISWAAVTVHLINTHILCYNLSVWFVRSFVFRVRIAHSRVWCKCTIGYEWLVHANAIDQIQSLNKLFWEHFSYNKCQAKYRRPSSLIYSNLLILLWNLVVNRSSPNIHSLLITQFVDESVFHVRLCSTKNKKSFRQNVMPSSVQQWLRYSRVNGVFLCIRFGTSVRRRHNRLPNFECGLRDNGVATKCVL